MMVSFMTRQEMGRFARLGKMAERQSSVARSFDDGLRTRNWSASIVIHPPADTGVEAPAVVRLTRQLIKKKALYPEMGMEGQLEGRH
jgi:hypothetical protein